MLTVLDLIFPADLSNHIASFLSGPYLRDKQYHKRIFLGIDKFRQHVPRPVFHNAVWHRRFHNNHLPEGVKLEAYNHVPCNPGRLGHIVLRSFDRIPEADAVCDCEDPYGGHWLFHYLHDTATLVQNHVNRVELGWDVAVATVSIFLCDYYFFDDILTRLMDVHPTLEWSKGFSTIALMDNTTQLRNLAYDMREVNYL